MKKLFFVLLVIAFLMISFGSWWLFNTTIPANEKINETTPTPSLPSNARNEKINESTLTFPLPSDVRLIALFFDDALQNQFDVALPILLEHDFKATFAVSTDYIGVGEGFWEYMDVEELKKLDKLGMDIASHGRTHPDLTNITHEQLREEIFGSKKILTELGFEVRTFVFPYGAFNDTVVNYTIEADYICARSAWNRPFDIKTATKRERFYVGSFVMTNQTLDEFKEIVAKSESNRMITIHYHHIHDGGGEWSTPVKNFTEQMRYLKEAGFTVVLLPDILINETTPAPPLPSNARNEKINKTTPTPPLPSDARIIALFFDDALQNQFDVALPILLEHDFKASFAVNVDSIGTGKGFWEYMCVEDLKKLDKLGMDIASHGRTHPDLTNITREQLREEIFGSKKILTELGFEVRTFVFPYGIFDDIVVNYVIEAGYICARSVAGYVIGVGYICCGRSICCGRPFDLKTATKRERFYIGSFDISNQTLYEFKEIVAKAESNHIVVIHYHHIHDGGREWSTPVKNFTEQMRYLKEAGFTVVLLPDIFK